VRLWDLESAPKETAKLDLKGGATAAAFSPDGKLLVTGDSAKFVKVWKLDGPKPRESLIMELGGGVASANFTPDGKAVIVLLHWSFDEDRIAIWGLDKEKRYESNFNRHIEAVAMAPDGRHLALVTEQRSVWIVRLPE
jgi:WD40 repeat protein